ncbi:MAG: bifunctional hydroxymethylpyrimidine kinase/phosphomethylpyrimidine kinase [Candidatus Omnitrophica bacterium]|nr:bifunctional hydroxymethylpyrimidine kinase/phosphomethylpyrimidine kinase [Candidatus Omnitrophota bacterium]
MIPIALTLAGSDPSGGAGIQADLKTFHQMGVYGMSVITLLTVQNTQRLDEVSVLNPDLVMKQLNTVLEDITPGAAKTGALGSAEVIEALGERAARFDFPLVVDPVMISKHGAALMEDSARARQILCKKLLPHAFLVTPNIPEASILSGISIQNKSSLERAAKIIADFGPSAVLVKGGHAQESAEDILFYEGKFHSFSAARITTEHTHGTGCTHSAAITAYLAKGMDLLTAVGEAKKFITRAIETNPGLGRGMGPVNHQALQRGSG